ncbi:hypothetical protein BaRGS_00003818, partial [Batillaria attramentaria]
VLMVGQRKVGAILTTASGYKGRSTIFDRKSHASALTASTGALLPGNCLAAVDGWQCRISPDVMSGVAAILVDIFQKSGGKGNESSAQHEILSLQAKIKELEKNAAEIREQAQHEVASLQDVHQNKMATLKKRHKDEMAQLKSKLSTLEQQLADVRDTDSTGTAHSASVLPESDRTESEGSSSHLQMELAGLKQQLASMTQEKDKVQTAKSHLQDVLQELQAEVEMLQTQREEHLVKIAELDTALRKQSQQHADQISSLRHQLEELEEERSRAVHSQQQVGLDLIHAKQCLLDQLEANHADTQDILSDLRSVRQQLHMETAGRQQRLLTEKQDMAMKLYSAGVQESSLKSSIIEAGTELQKVSKETESLVDQLGNSEQQRVAADVIDNLERENLVLKEQSVKLQEQITVLEKRVASQQADWQTNQDTISTLWRQLRQLKGETGSDTDNTLDQSFTSDNVDSVSITSPAPTATSSFNEEQASADWQIEREALEEVLAQLKQELREKDERLSQLSTAKDRSVLEQELESIKQEKDTLQGELSALIEREKSLKDEKDELEISLGELDDQHQEATNHLIAARNALLTQLTDSQKQVKDLQEELQNLSMQRATPDVSPDDEPSASASNSDISSSLREELRKAQDELSASKQLAESKDAEIADLKTKLQKGSLAVNDLHMDKKELEEELGRKQEEVKAKVAQIKALREEKTKLVEENKDLCERLQELEDELESWQQRNEDSQVERKEAEKLHTELAHLQSDYSDLQQALQTLTEECEELRTSNTKLEEERDTLKKELTQVVEKAMSMQKVTELEKQMAELSIQSPEAKQSHQRLTELENQVAAFRQQIDTLTREKEELEQTSGYHPHSSDNESTHTDTEGSAAELIAQNEQLTAILLRRRRALEQFGVQYAERRHRQNSGGESAENAGNTPYVTQGLVCEDLIGPSVPELKTDTEQILQSLQAERTALEKLQTGHSGDSAESEHVQLPHLCGSSHELLVVQAENEHLSLVIKDKDTCISDLHENLQTVQNERAQLAESLVLSEQRQQACDNTISEKENEVKDLQAQKDQLMKMCEDAKAKLSDAESHISTLKSQLLQTETDFQQVQAELEVSRHAPDARSEDDETSITITQLQRELASAQERLVRLEAELKEKEETLSCHQAGIEALNAKCEEQSKELESTHTRSSQQENIIALLRQNSLSVEQELEIVKSQLHRAMTFLTPEQRVAIHDDRVPMPVSSDSSLPALEFPQKPALELVNVEEISFSSDSDQKPDGVAENGCVEEPEESSEGEDADRREYFSRLTQQIEDLQKQVEEKEEIICDLQQNNASLLQMLEARSLTQQGDANLLEVHKLESEVKALKVEKEQMLAVMNEKSREASSLKAEVMRLMSVISAEKTALDKLQKDNQALMSRSPKDDSMDDMQREALQNLSRLVRDREVEIEALKQKNETLMAVLQDMNQGGGGAVRARTDGAFVNQKHAESVAYHAEIQRLNALRAEEGERVEKLQAEYDKLCSQFEDRNQSLLKAQNDLINYKQRFADIEVKYGGLLQKSNASETVDAASFRAVEEEKERLASRQAELQQAVHERDEKIRTLTDKLRDLENTSKARDAENASLRKQVEHLGFQLKDLGSETEDLRKDRETAEQRMQERESESHIMKDVNNRLTLSLREKEFEVTSLQERLHKVTALLSEQQGEKTQVTQLLHDQDAAAEATARLQQEVGQLTLGLKQKQQELSEMQAENLRLKDKEHKLNRELERLRGHLLQIEEGYTREALEAEEREKSLRTRLADAEEKLLSSASQVQSASQQASQQVESLQQQLHTIAAQRDAAYMQVASLQEQCQQYASSLSNLQLVLEQFQKEKDSQIASETERYQQEAQRLKDRTQRLEAELRQAKAELEEASDGLAAASRLSEQLDRKEEALQAMKEEVQKRESVLRAAEEQIHKLTSSTEAKVDRVLMKNLLLGYFHTPSRNRKDAIHAIGSVLGFTHDDFLKIEESDGGGSWVTSLLRRARTGSSPPTTPVRHMKTPEFNQSFSQLFVKFLEKESTPPPAPFRLPAEEMAREAQQRHHVRERDPHDKPAFNPFTAPRHVSMPIPVGPAAAAATSSSSHILMAPPGSPTTTFPVFSPFTLSQDGQAGSSSGVSEVGSGRNTPQTSSNILKDVLGSSGSTRELQFLPYFYLSGFPKCGSTDLFQRLCLHPEVAPVDKEPQWLARGRFENLAEGDGSPTTVYENHFWYLYPGNENCSEPRVLTVDYVRHLNPGTKIIVILRNPTSRLYSSYKFYKQFRRFKSNREEFHEWAKTQLKQITDCFNESGIRRCAYNVTFTRRNSCRPMVGIYYVYIQDWLLRFPRDQMYFVRLEDLSANVTGEMTKLFAFLELDPVSEDTMAKIESAKEANVGRLSQTFGPILPATKSLLDDFYRPFNRRLAQLLGDDLFLWEDH